MEFCFLLIQFTLTLFLVSRVYTEDLLDDIQISEDNPEELNDFLTSVLRHKNTFKGIRSQVANQAYGRNYDDFDPTSDHERYEKSPQKRFMYESRPVNDIFPYMYDGSSMVQELNRPNRHVGHGRSKKFKKYRFKRDSSEGHRYRHVEIKPLSQSGVLIDKNDYEAQQNENKLLRVRSADKSDPVIVSKHSTKSRKHHKHAKKRKENVSNNKTSTAPSLPYTIATTAAPEFYFTVDHDILGLQQDAETEYQNETAATPQPKKPSKPPKPRRNDDYLLNSLSPQMLMYNNHLLSKRDDSDYDEDKPNNKRRNNEEIEHYIVPVYNGEHLELDPKLLKPSHSIKFSDHNIEDAGLPQFIYNKKPFYPQFIAHSNIDDLSKLSDVYLSRRSTDFSDLVLKKIQTEPSVDDYKNREDKKMIYLKNQMKNHEDYRLKPQEDLNKPEYVRFRTHDEKNDFPNTNNRNHEEPSKNHDQKDDTYNKKHEAVTIEKNEDQTRHNIFLEEREKLNKASTPEDKSEINVIEQSPDLNTPTSRTKIPDSSIYSRLNKPTKERFDLLQKKDSHQVNARNNSKIAHNFKVIEIEDDTEANTETPLVTDKAKMESLIQKHFPTYAPTRKDQLLDSTTKQTGTNTESTSSTKTTKGTAEHRRETANGNYNKPKNKLEDETAPTSAIEQAELGRSTELLNFNTTTIAYVETTHQTFAIRNSDSSFQVKEAKDMIHIRSDQLDQMSKKEGDDGATNEDYGDDVAGDSNLEETVDQMKEILDQDIKVRDATEDDDNSNPLSDDNMDEELEKISKIQNDFMYDGDKKRQADDYYINVNRKLKAIDFDSGLNEDDDFTQNKNFNFSNHHPQQSSGSYYSNFDLLNHFDSKPSIDLANENEKSKRNLDDDESSYIDDDLAKDEEDNEEEVDSSAGNALVYMKKKIMPEPPGRPMLFAKSADSVEGQERLDKANSLVDLDARNVNSFTFDDNENRLNKLSNFMSPPEGFRPNNLNTNKVLPDDPFQLDKPSINYNSKSTLPKYLFGHNDSPDDQSFKDQIQTSQNPEAPDLGTRNQNDMNEEPVSNEFTNPMQPTVNENDKNRVHPPELIIHIIRTGPNNNDLSNIVNDVESFGHGHRHNPHNKIPAMNSSNMERSVHYSEIDAQLALTEGPIVMETIEASTKKKVQHLEDSGEKKRSKLSALTDRQHGKSEPQLLAPLSLTDNKTNNVRSVNAKKIEGKKGGSSLLNNVESFKDIVEKSEKTNKSKRETSLTSMEEPIISPVHVQEEEEATNNRRKRKLQYFDNNEMGYVPDSLWQYNNNMKILKRNDENDEDYEKLSKRKAAHRRKMKNAKKARRRKHKKTKPKTKAKLDECMLKHHKIKKPPDDIGQIRDVLTGHLTEQIIDKIQDRLKKNDRLFNEFGKFILTDEARKEVENVEGFRRAQAKVEIQHNQMMLHEIIEGLNDIVLAQIHHRLCQHPPPEIKEFLRKITSKSSKQFGLAEGIPLPQANGVADHQPTDLENGKFLFPDVQEPGKADTLDVKKKEKMIQNLLAKYDRMSSKCKVQVQPVREYLMDHFNMLHQLAQGKKPQQEEQKLNGRLNPSPLFSQTVTEGAGLKPEAENRDMNPNNLNPANINPDKTGAALVSNNGLSPNSLVGNNNDLPMKALRNSQDDAFSGLSAVKNNFGDFGLGKKKGFFSSSELDKYIEDAMKNQNEDKENENMESLVKREVPKTNWDVSDKYKKLMETAALIRMKRKTEEKLGKLFGDKVEKDASSDSDVKDYSRIKFESPVVYSLDH